MMKLVTSAAIKEACMAASSAFSIAGCFLPAFGLSPGVFSALEEALPFAY
jgi:hypothetical protein